MRFKALVLVILLMITFFAFAQKVDQTISFGVLPMKTFGDPSFDLTATASSGLPVSYASSNTQVAIVSGTTVTIVGAGQTVITANQGGNVSFNPAPEVSQVLLVSKANQTISFEALPPKRFGDPSFELTAKATSGLTVSYVSSNMQVASVSGTTVTIVGAGQAFITAKQPGNSSFTAASEVTQTLFVAKANQTINFPDPNLSVHVFGDQPFNLGISSSSGLNNTITVSNSEVGSVFNGFFSINGAGECTITASNAGNANYNPASSVSRVVFVRKASQAISFPSTPLKTYGNSPFSPNALSTSGLPIVFGTSDPSVAVIQDGQVVIVGAGVVDITADQQGNKNYLRAVTVTRTLTIQKATQGISFLSPSSATYGATPVNLNAVATSGLSITSFTSKYDSIASIENTTLTINGAGTSTITAFQKGNQNYLPATATQTLVVNKANQVITFPAIPSQVFGSSPFTLNAVASSGLPVSYTSLRKTVALVSGNTVLFQSIGTATIVASQSGNSNYLPASAVSQNIAIEGTLSEFQMFGSTAIGGTGNGTLFGMKSNGANLITTFNFPASASNMPNGGLIKGSDNRLYGVMGAGGNPANGVVFSINPDGSNYMILYNFKNTDGSFPTGSLLEASNGYLYGTTMYGGLNVGVIYRLRKDGTDFSVLHKFNSGYNASGGLIQAADGKLYGATLQGGTIGYGTLYSINPDGSGYNEFLSFDGAARGSTPRGALLQGPDLFLYGVTGGGGVLGKGVLFKVKTDGTSYNKLVEFDGSAKGAYGASTPTLASDGKLYGMTQSGGANDKGTVFSISPNGVGFIKILDLGGITGSNPLGSLIEALDGNLYGMTSKGGTKDLGIAFRVRKNGTGFFKLLDFIGTNGASPQLGPFLELQNLLFFGMTQFGGASNAGVIFSISSTGNFALLREFPQPASSPQTLSINNDFTKVFGIASGGGAYGAGAVFSAMRNGSNYSEITQLQGDWLYSSGLTYSNDNTLWGIGREGLLAFSYFLFKVDENGSNFQRAATFSDPLIAAEPRALVDFKTDYIYGISSVGGTFNSGTIFKIKKDGSELSKVTDIPGGILGSRPYIQIIKHSNGRLYGVTHEGGVNNDGVIYSITDDVYQKLTDLKQSTTGAYPKRIIELNGGSLCVATGNGGTNNNGTLFVTDANGQSVEKIFDFTNQTGIGVTDMVQSADGYIFVALESAGAEGKGSIIRILPDGSGYQKLVDFNGVTGTYPNSIRFERLAQNILSFDDIPQKHYTDPPFLLKATSNSGALIRFSSSDPSIATIDGYRVTIHKVGTVLISAQVPASGNYAASPLLQKTLTILKADQQLVFPSITQKKYGDASFTLNVTTTSKLPISLSSSNVSVASISQGRVSIQGTGSTIITASVAPNSNFNSVIPQQQPLIVVKNSQTIQFDPIATRYVDSPPFSLSASNTSGLPINFFLDNPSVVSLSGNVVMINTSGQVKITASASGDNNYSAAPSVEQSLQIVKRVQSIDFELQKDRNLDDLTFSIQPVVSSSGLPVTLTNSSHISISGTRVSILRAGKASITISQGGNSIFLPAATLNSSFCIVPSKPLVTTDTIDLSNFILTSNVRDGNQWYKDGTLLLGENSQSLTVKASGTYTAKISIEGCTGAQSDPKSFVITGAENENPNFEVYPNPVDTRLSVEWPDIEEVNIRVFTLTGYMLKKIKSSSSKVEIELQDVPPGIYLLEVQTDKTVATKRIIKR
jgi:uncharacterized repeat protein (TIGR03803 family)